MTGHSPGQSDPISPVQSKQEQEELFFGIGGLLRSIPT